MLNHKTIVLCKVESTYNTDPTPDGTNDAMLVENPQWSLVNARMVDRVPARTSQGMLKPIYAGTLVQISFDVELKGSGAAGTAPDVGAALQACALSETVSGGTSVTYAPASSAQKSCTIYLYRDGKLIKATGCRGNVTLSVGVGGYGKWTFTFTGHLVSESDAALPSPTYQSTVPVALINIPFVIDSRTPGLTKLDIDMGNQIAMPEDIVAADGYGQIQLTGRNVNGSFDDDDVLVATYDWMAKWQAGTVVSITTGAIGGTAGNITTVTMPYCAYTEHSPGDKSGIVTRQANFKAAESSGDDEISIVFT